LGKSKAFYPHPDLVNDLHKSLAKAAAIHGYRRFSYCGVINWASKIGHRPQRLEAARNPPLALSVQEHDRSGSFIRRNAEISLRHLWKTERNIRDMC